MLLCVVGLVCLALLDGAKDTLPADEPDSLEEPSTASRASVVRADDFTLFEDSVASQRFRAVSMSGAVSAAIADIMVAEPSAPASVRARGETMPLSMSAPAQAKGRKRGTSM